MKAFHVALWIAGTTALVGGAFVIRAKKQYADDAHAIEKLIAEYKSMGVPTNADEFFHKIPDSENAWLDIAPLLLNNNGLGNGPIYRSRLGVDFIYAGNKSDLPQMHRYLAVNQAKRDKVRAFLAQKPGLQVPHDFNQGFFVLLPEFSVIKQVSNDFCLEAYAAWLEGHPSDAKAKLDAANRLGNACIDQGHLIGTMVGNGIHRHMVDTGFRLAEQNPSLVPSLAAYFSQTHLFQSSDIKRLLENEFIAQVSTCRYMDLPVADRKEFRPPLDKIFKMLETGEFEKDFRSHPGDYLPDSPAMRAVLRKRLELCKPFLQHFLRNSNSLPPLSEYVEFSDFRDLPPIYAKYTYSSSDFDQQYSMFNFDRQFADISLNLWTALLAKAKTGRYPTSLLQLGNQFVYTVTSKGISIRSEKTTSTASEDFPGTTGSRPLIQLGYPASLLPDPSAFSGHVKRMKDFESGKVDEGGTPFGYGPKSSVGPRTP